MGLISSILHRVSAHTRGIPEWAPHDHDALHRNVPFGTGVETRLGFRMRLGRRYRRLFGMNCAPAYARVPYTPFARVGWYPPAYTGVGLLGLGNPFAWSSFNGVPYPNSTPWGVGRARCGAGSCGTC
jgi:hypothetical protein